MKTLNKYHKGFTLIELLVVISIISLLSSVVLASLKGAREKAILTKTVAEMKSLQVAIELYKSQFGVYPGGGVLYDSQIYSNPSPNSTTYSSTFSVSLLDFQNTYLVSNKLLANPVLAPTYETCDFYCINKGYVLFYFPYKKFLGSYTYSCGGVPIDNYIIFFSANTKKLNLPEATMSTNGVQIYNASTESYPTSGSPYTYCLAG